MLGNALGSFDRTINVHGVGLRIVQGKEWSGKILTVSSHLLLGILQRLGQKVHGLVRCDGKFLFGGNLWIPRLDLGSSLRVLTIIRRSIATGVFELTKRRQESGTVRLIFTIFSTKTKLDRMPVTLLCSRSRHRRKVGY